MGLTYYSLPDPSIHFRLPENAEARFVANMRSVFDLPYQRMIHNLPQNRLKALIVFLTFIELTLMSYPTPGHKSLLLSFTIRNAKSALFSTTP